MMEMLSLMLPLFAKKLTLEALSVVELAYNWYSKVSTCCGVRCYVLCACIPFPERPG